MLRLLKKTLRSLKSSETPQAGPRERDATWYDSLFAHTKNYSIHYSKSHYYFLWSIIVDRVRRSGIKTVLEMGCGSGQLASYLTAQCDIEYVGVDFSTEAIRIAQTNVPTGRFLVEDARNPSLYDRSFDALICTELLEHVEADLEIMSAFPQGTRCLLSVPNFDYAGHVRWFENAEQARERYGRFLDKLDILTLISPMDDSDKFYLLDGIRNSTKLS